MRAIQLMRGSARWTVLVGNIALKLPALSHWKLFLCGLLANMAEVQFSQAGWRELCPVLFHLPGGLLLVMPRVRVLSASEFDAFDYAAFVEHEAYHVPAENKPDSFGWWQGRIVAIDYH